MSMRFNGGVLSAGANPLSSGVRVLDLLVVAGGGGSSQSNDGRWGAGAGGAGGLLYRTNVSINGNSIYTITIGAGGVNDANGSNSSFVGNDVSIIALGGGAGGYNGVIGGSGGGGGWNGVGAAGTSGQGYAGANGGGYYGPGGAGGGAGGAASGTTAGVGATYSISGSSVTYARGGKMNFGNLYTADPQVPYSGNGGNGNGVNGFPFSLYGDSGTVVLRYPTTFAKAAQTTGFPTYLSSGGYHIYSFTSSGTILF